MNFPLVLRLLSGILLALAGAFAASAAVTWGLDEGLARGQTLAGMGWSALIVSGLAAVFWWDGRRAKQAFFAREALAVVGLGWLLASAVGALPYILIVPQIGIIGAIFESASGLTTTGASVLSNLEDLSRGLHFWRAISQWIGGLGVVVFFVVVLASLGAGAKVLFSRESSASVQALDVARIQSGARALAGLYLGLTAACVLTFRLCGLNWYEAVIHAFTTLSTGGFSTRSASVAAFANPALEWAMIAFMALGGTSFVFLLRLLRGDGRVWRSSAEVTMYYVIIGGATLLVAGFLAWQLEFNTTLEAAVRTAAFQVISILTTTGYASADFNQWLPVNHVLLLALMVVGGCAGSTAGGVKVARVMVALKVCRQQIELAYRSRAVRTMRMNGEVVTLEAQARVVQFLVLMAVIALGGFLLIALLEPNVSLEGSLTAMAACLFNIGPGLAEVGPTQNFAFFHPYTQLGLVLLMILGRLELFAILVLFSPPFWRKY